MKRIFAGSSVLVAVLACASFDAGDQGSTSVDAGTTTDATSAPPLESGAPRDGGSSDAEGQPPSCPADAVICETFDDGYGQAWSAVGTDPVPVTGSAGGRTGVLVSHVPGEDTYPYKGTLIKQALGAHPPIRIDFDMRVEAPDTAAGGASPNFQVLTLSTNELDLVFFLYPSGKVEVITGTKPGGTLINHAVVDAKIKLQEWAHYTLKIDLAANGSFELRQGSTLLATDSLVATTSNADLVVGISRNNNQYDLQAEYDNLVVRPGP